MADKKDRTAATAGTGRVIEDPMDYIDFVSKYHGDETFRKTVDDDPAGTLRSEGLAVPKGVKVKLLSTDENTLHIVLPSAPKRK